MLSEAHTRKTAGYTLIEMIVVMAMLAILAGIAVPRFLDTTALKEFAASRQLILDIRWAQRVATATHQSCGIVVTAPGRYRVFVGSTSTSRVDPLTGVAEEVDIQAMYGATILPQGASLTFDARGRPASGSTLAFTIGAKVVNIASETGFVK